MLGNQAPSGLPFALLGFSRVVWLWVLGSPQLVRDWGPDTGDPLLGRVSSWYRSPLALIRQEDGWRVPWGLD